jgi:lipid-binding SYLF domain-containing protein
MKLRNLFTVGTVILSLAAGNALAQDDKAKKQAEIKKVTQTSLQKFYKAKPELKGEVEKAPGYAVFTTYGLSFLIGGAGGKGIAHDNKTKKNTYMSSSRMGTGPGAGKQRVFQVFVFKTKSAMDQFVTKGWEASGGGLAQAGAEASRPARQRRDHRRSLHAHQERTPGRPGGCRIEILEGQGPQLSFRSFPRPGGAAYG